MNGRVRPFKNLPAYRMNDQLSIHGEFAGTECVANGRLIRFAGSRRVYVVARHETLPGRWVGDLEPRDCKNKRHDQLVDRVIPIQRFTSLRLCLMHHYVFDYGRLVASVTSSLSSAARQSRRDT